VRIHTGRLALEIRRSRGGLAALLALLAITTVAVVVIAGGLRLNMPWSSEYTVRVAVDNAKGVVPGKQEVRLAGIPVGEITGAQLVGGRPILTLTLQSQYAPLYRNARLRLRPKTPLDDLYMDIEDRGTTAAGELTSSQILPAQRTIVPVDVGPVLDSFTGDTRVRLAEAINELGAGLKDHGQQFDQALVDLAPFLRAAQRLTREMAVRQAATRHLIHNFRLMMEALGSRDRQLRELVSGGAQTFSEIAAQDSSLSQVIVQFPPTLKQLLPAFSALRAATTQLNPALDDLRATARKLPGGLSALRSFSRTALPSLTALAQTLPSLDRLMTALRPTAAGLQHDFALLLPQAPRLNRVTAAIVPCEPAIDKFFANTLSLMKFYDANGVIARGQTVDGLDPTQTADSSCAPGGPRK
jgi:phospholipid/cholesterol/gamma-HCH transport system substrate-binding protein